MSGRRSKYNEISIKSVRHDKRSIRLAGSQEYDGRFYKCWYCGFSGNDINRNLTGDGDGVSYSITVEANDPYGSQTASVIAPAGRAVLINLNPAFTERHNISMSASSGCAQCGCRNYK